MLNRNNPDYLYQLRWLRLGWPQSVAATRLGVSTRTLSKWEIDCSNAPVLAITVMEFYAGELAPFNSAWNGWFIKEGELFSPHGYSFKPSDLLQHAWLCPQQLSTAVQDANRLQSENGRLRESLIAEREALAAKVRAAVTLSLLSDSLNPNESLNKSPLQLALG